MTNRELLQLLMWNERDIETNIERFYIDELDGKKKITFVLKEDKNEENKND